MALLPALKLHASTMLLEYTSGVAIKVNGGANAYITVYFRVSADTVTKTGSAIAVRFDNPSGSLTYPLTINTAGGSVLCSSYISGAAGYKTLPSPIPGAWDGNTYSYNPSAMTATANFGDTVPKPKSVSVSLTIVNNLGKQQTLYATGGLTNESKIVPALGTVTWNFTVTGNLGEIVTITSSPDGIIWDSNYDPIVISSSTEPIVRSGKIGKTPTTRKIRIVVTSFATSACSITGTLDGSTIGQLVAGLTGDPSRPVITSYDYEVPISSSSSLGFTVPQGHTITQQQNISENLWSYSLTVDSANQTAGNVTTVTPPSSDGTVTATTTNTNTGTTVIDRSSPGTSTGGGSLGAIFGIGGVGTAGGSSYGNTTDSAGNASSQDAANSLAAIERNTKATADATAYSAKVLKDASEDPKTGSAALKGLRDNLLGKAQDAVNDASSAADQGREAAENAYAAFGALPAIPSEPSSPGDTSVDLEIGPGKTLKMYLNPFSSNGPFGGAMASVGAFVRRLIAWGLVGAFFIWCMSRIREMMAKPFATAPFGDTLANSINSIKVAGFGGGIGYAVKLTAYALILTIVLTMPVVIMAAVTAGLPWGELVSTWSAGPGQASGLLGNSIAMANQVVPWTMLMITPVWYFVVEFILFPSQFFWMMFMKFLPI